MYCTVQEAIQIIQKGEMLVVVDNEQRENEGDLLMAASFATPEKVNFMATHGRGLICVPMEESYIKRLELEPMVQKSSDPKETAFTVSVDMKGQHTGISAFERAETINFLASKESQASQFTKPGHIFPLCAKKGGVLEREGHTEAAVDLAKLAGLSPVGVICEIMDDDGRMAKGKSLKDFCERHQLKCLTIEALKAYIGGEGTYVASTELPTAFGVFNLQGFQCKDGSYHVALLKGNLSESKTPLIRIHSECLTGDAFTSLKCDCGEQLKRSMAAIQESECGGILYLKQEGRGIGLINKIKAYALQETGLDTAEANVALGFPEDMRSYQVAGHMLRALGVRQMKLLTNNPDKVQAMSDEGFKIIERVPLVGENRCENRRYLETKKNKMGHWL